ncbi:MAG: hypothetical protein Q9213_007172 [Squamulea squamosa]
MPSKADKWKGLATKSSDESRSDNLPGSTDPSYGRRAPHVQNPAIRPQPLSYSQALRGEPSQPLSNYRGTAAGPKTFFSGGTEGSPSTPTNTTHPLPQAQRQTAFGRSQGSGVGKFENDSSPSNAPTHSQGSVLRSIPYPSADTTHITDSAQVDLHALTFEAPRVSYQNTAVKAPSHSIRSLGPNLSQRVSPADPGAMQSKSGSSSAPVASTAVSQPEKAGEQVGSSGVNTAQATSTDGLSKLVIRPGTCTDGELLKLSSNHYKVAVSKHELIRYSVQVIRQDAEPDSTATGPWPAKSRLIFRCIWLALQEPQYVVSLENPKPMDILATVRNVVSGENTMSEEGRNEVLAALNIYLSDFANAQFLMHEWHVANPANPDWNATKTTALQSFLKGLRVKTRHMTDDKGRPRPRIKCICGLAQVGDGQKEPKPPEVDILGANPGEVRFWPTYRNFADAERLAETNWSVVNVGSHDHPVYLPAEACEVLPGQLYKKKLSPEQTNSMIGVAVTPSQKNKQLIEQGGLQSVGLRASSNSKMVRYPTNLRNRLLTLSQNGFGLRLPESSLLQVNGRKLQPSFVEHATNTLPEPGQRFPTTWNMKDMVFVKTYKVKSWVCLRIRGPPGPKHAATAQKETERIASAFMARLQALGIQTPKPHSHHIEFDGRASENFEKWMTRFCSKPGNPVSLDFLLIMLPDDSTDRYGQLCDQIYGVNNICVLTHKVYTKQSGNKPSNVIDYKTLSNLCLKVNLKMKGTNFIVPNEALDFIERDDTMLVGIDVTHPSAASAPNAPSVAAMVASMDPRLAQWPAELRIQQGRSKKQGGGIEMTTFNLKEMLKSQLLKWQTCHQGKLPEYVLVFRDGISETQYAQSVTKELPKLREAFDSFPTGTTQSGKPPKFTLIVCAKRHHTRFYKPVPDKPHIFENPPGGTYVDTGVTESYPWDFYLQSHSATKGTARPAHYIVLHDKIIRETAREKKPPVNPANLLAQITYNMCYLFGRTTGSTLPQDVYEGKERPPAAAEHDDNVLRSWQDGLQRFLDVHANQKDRM